MPGLAASIPNSISIPLSAQHDRNVQHTTSDWHFTTKDARTEPKPSRGGVADWAHRVRWCLGIFRIAGLEIQPAAFCAFSRTTHPAWQIESVMVAPPVCPWSSEGFSDLHMLNSAWKAVHAISNSGGSGVQLATAAALGEAPPAAEGHRHFRAIYVLVSHAVNLRVPHLAQQRATRV
jgi:hypothetical protein